MKQLVDEIQNNYVILEVSGGFMDSTKKKKSESSTNNSNVSEKYVYFVMAKEWRKVSPGIFTK